MRARLDAVFADAGATGFLHARELNTGAEVELRADEPVVAASVFKVPVLLEVCRQISAGTLLAEDRIRVPARPRTYGPTGISALLDEVEVSLRDLATLMIVVSDNAATDMVLELIGLDAVNATLAELGLAGTVLVENCRDLIDEAAAAIGPDAVARLAAGEVDPAVLAGLRALDPLRTNRTTARESTELLGRIWRAEAGPADACAEARRILGRQIWPHRLRSGFPGRVTVSGKTGTLPGIRNEIGVVEYPDGGAYAVAVFTRASTWDDPQPAIDAAIGTAARVAVEHLRSLPGRR